MGLEHLTHVRDDRPACQLKPGYPAIRPVWVIEPGDATHYELAERGDMVFACVGHIDAPVNGILVLLAPGNPQGHRFMRVIEVNKPSEYTVAVLTYYASIALGVEAEEPIDLSARRSPR